MAVLLWLSVLVPSLRVDVVMAIFDAVVVVVVVVSIARIAST